MRNSVSLGLRCVWGINNALFYVAKDSDAKTEKEREKVLGVAMWMPPREAGKKETWKEWMWNWWLWGRQVGMNLWWGRGGLNVKVCRHENENTRNGNKTPCCIPRTC